MSDTEVGSKRSYGQDRYDDYGDNNASAYKKSRRDHGPNKWMRFLMVGRNCGAVIGKGGENIKRLRQDHGVQVNLPDARSHERVLSLRGDRDKCVNVIKEVIAVCKEAPYAVDQKRRCTYEINYLAQSDQVGAVIGKGGQKIKDIREESGGKVKVYQNCLPNSNERVVAVGGDDEASLIAAFNIVLDVLAELPMRQKTIEYDPKNQGEGDNQQHMGGGGAPGGGFGGGPGPDLGGGANQLAGLGGLSGLGGLGGLAANAATILNQLGVGGQSAANLLGAAGMGNLANISNLLGVNQPTGDNMGQSSGYNDQSGGYNSHQGGGHHGSQSSNRDRNGYNAEDRGDRSGRGDRGGDRKEDFTEMITVTKVNATNDMCGAIIGKGGQRVKDIRNATGVKVDFSETEKGSKEDRVITITGTNRQTIAAQQMMADCVRNRNK